MKWLWQTRAAWGERLLAIWLIGTGVVALTGVGASIPHVNLILAVLAVAAGVLLLLKR